MTAESVITRTLHASLSGLENNKRIWIAFSGGLDSTVLLHAANHVVVSTGHSLAAIHVDHGLHADSGKWRQHCNQFCDQLNIRFENIAVDTKPYLQLGVEGAARAARYQAFESNLHARDVLLTAHHADDQLETVLLQLFRGSGSSGLAGCAAQRPLGEALLLRPLLHVTRADISAYAEQFDLRWLQDPANESMQFDRNYLRHELMPSLHARWPGLHATVSRSAQWQSENAELLDDLAQADLENCQIELQSALPCECLARLSEARQRNLLRWWIRQNGFQVPNAQVMQRIIEDAINSDRDREPCVSWQACEIRKYRNVLYLQKTLPPHDANRKLMWNLNEPLELPELDVTLTSAALKEFGLDIKDINYLQVGFRVGGEVIRPRGRGCQKDLKTLFQEAGVLPWLRNRIPLLFKDGQLICVWGYWVGE